MHDSVVSDLSFFSWIFEIIAVAGGHASAPGGAIVFKIFRTFLFASRRAGDAKAKASP